MQSVYAGTLDTNILLRFILADDPGQHKKAKNLIISPRIWHIPLLSIAEVVYVLEGKGYQRADIRRNIEVICSFTNLHFVRSIVQPAIELYSAWHALSFVDACLAFEAMASGAEPLYTFDKKLAKQAPNTKLAG